MADHGNHRCDNRTITLGTVISFSAGQAGYIFGLFLGAIGGFIWWWQGAKHINDLGPEIVEQFQSAAPKIGEKHLSLSGENTTGYWIRIGEEESPALDVHKRYKFQSLLVGDNSITIHGRCTIWDGELPSQKLGGTLL